MLRAAKTIYRKQNQEILNSQNENWQCIFSGAGCWPLGYFPLMVKHYDHSATNMMMKKLFVTNVKYMVLCNACSVWLERKGNITDYWSVFPVILLRGNITSMGNKSDVTDHWPSDSQTSFRFISVIYLFGIYYKINTEPVMITGWDMNWIHP